MIDCSLVQSGPKEKPYLAKARKGKSRRECKYSVQLSKIDQVLVPSLSSLERGTLIVRENVEEGKKRELRGATSAQRHTPLRVDTSLLLC